MARKRQGRDQERTQRYKKGGVMGKIKTARDRRLKREALVGVTGRRKQDQRRAAISDDDPKARTLDTMKRMKEYKSGKPSEYKCGGKVKKKGGGKVMKYAKGGRVRGGGAAIRGMKFGKDG